MKKALLVISVLLLASLACSVSSLLPGGNSGSQPSGSNALFSDDFSDVDSGWDRINKDYKITDYDGEGGYRIWVNETQFDVWATPYQNFSGPIAIEVDATKIGGPDDNDFGVICRYTEDTTAQTFSFYYFIISSDGYAVIGRVLNSEQQWISSESMLASDAIRKGFATNTIRAVCAGSNLELFVNGTSVASVSDSSIPEGGDIGLMAGTFSEPGTDILFDNLTVSRP